MRPYRLRTDLRRDSLDGFALPLGIEAIDLTPPRQGYTRTYTPGEQDDPDTYAFQVVVSHERVREVALRAFGLLRGDLCGIIEIFSRDAYRLLDVYIGDPSVPIPLRTFLDAWNRYEPVLLEDANLGIGANCEDPFVEVFLDQWKAVNIHVPLTMHDEVVSMLEEFDLHEVQETWAKWPDDELNPRSRIRPVLALVDEYSPDVDEVLLDLRHELRLELNIDPSTNIDDAGRQLGFTLWHALTLVEDAEGDPDRGAYASIWATASSMHQLQDLIDAALEKHPQWRFSEIYTVDRVAFDERPDELSDLPPRRTDAALHLLKFDPWEIPRSGNGDAR